MKNTYVSPDRILREVAILREMMLTVHYYAESHWLAAAVSFPGLCNSEKAQDALRHAATIAWQFGFPEVSHWLNTEFLSTASLSDTTERSARGLTPITDVPDVT
jgi:hypothetical protein